jgi:hypothetical protein
MLPYIPKVYNSGKPSSSMQKPVFLAHLARLVHNKRILKWLDLRKIPIKFGEVPDSLSDSNKTLVKKESALLAKLPLGNIVNANPKSPPSAHN